MDTHSSEVMHHVVLQASWTGTQKPGDDASPIFHGIFFRVSIKPHLKPTIKDIATVWKSLIAFKCNCYLY